MFKTIYLWLIMLCSRLISKKQTSGVVYLLSFAGNEDFIIRLARRVRQEPGGRLTVLYRPNCQASAKQLQEHGITCRQFSDGGFFLTHQLKVVLQARLVFADNYYAFLGGCIFNKEQTRVIQLWHANGAVKTFGWEEPRTKDRSTGDKNRFQKVYDQFDDFVVGSTQMAEVFCNSYHQSMEKMQVLGYPRTDLLFAKEKKAHKRKQILQQHPELQDKEIILYAPTYRETATGEIYFDLPADFTEMLAHLNQKQVVVMKLHPHVKEKAAELKKLSLPHVVWVDDFSTNDLLLITQRLVTDYSSVIFDYSLLENAQQIIFYCYDFENYSQVVGVQQDFSEWLPGRLVKTADQLEEQLLQPLTSSDFSTFNELWNTANDGHAVQRVIENYFYGN